MIILSVYMNLIIFIFKKTVNIIINTYRMYNEDLNYNVNVNR